MDAQTCRMGCRCLLLLALVGAARNEGVQSCEEVRKLFQWRLVGVVKGLPDSPRAGKTRLAGAGLCAWARRGRLERRPGAPQLSGRPFARRCPFRPCGRAVNPREASGGWVWSIRSAAPLLRSPTALAARPTSGRSLPAPAALAWADASGDVRKANSWVQRGLTTFLFRVGIYPVPRREPLFAVFS